ncbi:FliM/FliN family flagellar motor switch protein [Pacificoceanicola onchidii]|uniref:FliM/FliN family flagellar motor switch protein n=1 Tax=Pacificoceanicola onchidii TaxID=2562685 RepID=UPI0010A35E17|nr:FliM/FliN family flagellar motor switch protein [Pacificoceanicola onchidii]
MADGAQQDVLGQKAQAAQRAFEARGMSPSKALRRALSRTADVNWDLALVTQAVTVENLDQDGVIESLTAEDLLILMDGPDGALGLAVFGREVVAGLVEVQTIQQVSNIPVDPERAYTPTEAALMAPIIDGTMERFVENLGEHPILRQIEGFRFGAMLEDARSAGLLLDASVYRAFRAEVDLALGRRRGTISFILPERAKPKRGKGAPKSAEDNSPGPHEDVFARVEARLEAVLAQITLPLNRAQQLKPGELIPLPQNALDKVKLTAGKGGAVVVGRLGQLNGMRAVRLSLPAQVGAAKPAVEAADNQPPAEAAPALPDLPAAPEPADFAGMVEEPAFDPSEPEELPDLPALDFAAEASDFDLGGDLAEGGDFDFDPAPAEGDEDLPDIGDFASAPVEFDFEE